MIRQMKQQSVALPARFFRLKARELRHKTTLQRKARQRRFHVADCNSPDDGTPIKLRPQKKEISLENSPRSTKTVEDGRTSNTQVQWEGLGLHSPGCPRSRMRKQSLWLAVLL